MAELPVRWLRFYIDESNEETQ